MQELHPSDSSVSLPLVALLAARDASQLPADFTPISEEEYKRLLEQAVKVDAP